MNKSCYGGWCGGGSFAPRRRGTTTTRRRVRRAAALVLLVVVPLLALAAAAGRGGAGACLGTSGILVGATNEHISYGLGKFRAVDVRNRRRRRGGAAETSGTAAAAAADWHPPPTALPSSVTKSTTTSHASRSAAPVPHRSNLRATVNTADDTSRSDNNIRRTNGDDDGGGGGDVRELYFAQTLDHFRGGGGAPSSNVTFAQRYFVSDRYVVTHDDDGTDDDISSAAAAPPRRLVFVCVGGEGPALTASVLVDAVHCTGDMLETARRLHDQQRQQQQREQFYRNDTSHKISIHLAALEHRYYGKSYPKFDNTGGAAASSPVTNEHLVYLSSRQAAADVAHFVHTVYGDDATVLLFGGSYPGMLAAFARLKYPHYIAAAVSHSAPVEAVLDFAAYHAHVARDLAATDPRCLEIVVAGHAALSKLVQNASHHAGLAQQFHLCNATALAVSRNQQLWLGDGVVYWGAQENDPACARPYCNLYKKCAAVVESYDNAMAGNATTTPATAAVHALAHLAAALRASDDSSNDDDDSSNDDDDDDDDDGSCVDLDWEGTLAYIADPVAGMEGGLRSWWWQTCTEFGFYQTCESAGCPYAVGYHPLSQDLEVCRVAFGVDASAVAAAVHATNEWTGGWRLAATKVLSVTGTVDPWSEMALQPGNAHQLPVHQVPGASHHFWTHPVQPTDDAAVVAARDYIFETVQDWLFPANRTERAVRNEDDAAGGGAAVVALAPR